MVGDAGVHALIHGYERLYARRIDLLFLSPQLMPPLLSLSLHLPPDPAFVAGKERWRREETCLPPWTCLRLAFREVNEQERQLLSATVRQSFASTRMNLSAAECECH